MLRINRIVPMTSGGTDWTHWRVLDGGSCVTDDYAEEHGLLRRLRTADRFFQTGKRSAVRTLHKPPSHPQRPRYDHPPIPCERQRGGDSFAGGGRDAVAQVSL